MKEILITKTGGPAVLKVRDAPDPTPGEGEVRIRVKASGVNFADIMARTGMYPEAPPLPAVVGYEVSGIIDEIGSNVDPKLKGEAVLAVCNFKGNADTVIARAVDCVRKPAALTFVEAAAIPVVYLTAYMLIIHSGGLRKGQTILIQNAGGGVGLAAIDIAKHVGATTIGTASGRKHAFLKSRGLDHAIDYTKEDFVKEVKRITNDKGVDLIIDPVGGDAWQRNYSILRQGGRLGIFGASSIQHAGNMFLPFKLVALASFAFKMPKWGPLQLMDANKGVFGCALSHMFEEYDRVGEWFKEIVDGVEDGWVRPCVDSVWEFDRVGAAHGRLESRGNIGKVVLVPTAAEAVAYWAEHPETKVI
ncbi:hypothetical protein HK101_009276 [Irineochytrium annulatum]|nr:hypothetical protein HK101_009276 [Irineochytrium annulatum]